VDKPTKGSINDLIKKTISDSKDEYDAEVKEFIHTTAEIFDIDDWFMAAPRLPKVDPASLDYGVGDVVEAYGDKAKVLSIDTEIGYALIDKGCTVPLFAIKPYKKPVQNWTQTCEELWEKYILD
jgi:hypothetical protein